MRCQKFHYKKLYKMKHILKNNVILKTQDMSQNKTKLYWNCNISTLFQSHHQTEIKSKYYSLIIVSSCFDSYLGFLGWYFLEYVSFFQVVGWCCFLVASLDVKTEPFFSSFSGLQAEPRRYSKHGSTSAPVSELSQQSPKHGHDQIFGPVCPLLWGWGGKPKSNEREECWKTRRW